MLLINSELQVFVAVKRDNMYYVHMMMIETMKLKATVLAPWTRQPEMTVAKIEAMRMITPKMKIPDGDHHHHHDI